MIRHVVDDLMHENRAKYGEQDRRTFLDRWHAFYGAGYDPEDWTSYNQPIDPKSML